jgi:transcriptional regulator GlxA family with amidase domain
MNSDLLRSWLQQLRLVASSPELLESARNNPRAALQLSPFFIKRVEEFSHASSAEPLRLVDIAKADGLPERTLRDGFQKSHGISPVQYLRPGPA